MVDAGEENHEECPEVRESFGEIFMHHGPSGTLNPKPLKWLHDRKFNFCVRF